MAESLYQAAYPLTLYTTFAFYQALVIGYSNSR